MPETTVDEIRLKLQSFSAETPVVRSLVFVKEQGVLPDWEAGAHVRVSLPGGGNRPYSLMALPELGKSHWGLGVLLEEKGSGGSRFMHSLKVGDVVSVSAPVNHFRLHEKDAPAILFAGGIGITPILSMAAVLNARGTPYRLHYAGRTPESLAFLPQMRTICAAALSVHHDCDETRLDIRAALKDGPSNAHVYVCGPSGMIEAVKQAAAEQGVPQEHVHYELFKSDQAASENTAFEVEISSSGQVIEVAADESIIDALEKAGLDPLYDCKRGDCGVCQCGVISGVPDHRDVILSDDEKASNKVMQICVSRAKSPRLVLDI